MPGSASTLPPSDLNGDGSALDGVVEWSGWEEHGVWIWTVALIAGYGLLLHQQPLRHAFGEGWALIREQGNGWALGLTGILSLVMAAGEWWVGGGGEFTAGTELGFREADESIGAGSAMLEGVLDITSTTFASFYSGLGPLLETTGFPWLVVWLLAATGAAAGFLALQMIVLFFTVRTVMPGKRLRFWSLLEAAFRRTLRMWPAALAFSLVLPLCRMLPAGWLLTGLLLAGLLVFAFLHPAAAGDSRRRARPIPQCLDCWLAQPFAGLWFFFMVVLHGILFGLLWNTATAHVIPGSLGELAAGIGLGFIRVLIAVWLAASWAVFYAGAFPLRK